MVVPFIFIIVVAVCASPSSTYCYYHSDNSSCSYGFVDGATYSCPRGIHNYYVFGDECENFVVNSLHIAINNYNNDDVRLLFMTYSEYQNYNYKSDKNLCQGKFCNDISKRAYLDYGTSNCVQYNYNHYCSASFNTNQRMIIVIENWNAFLDAKIDLFISISYKWMLYCNDIGSMCYYCLTELPNGHCKFSLTYSRCYSDNYISRYTIDGKFANTTSLCPASAKRQI